MFNKFRPVCRSIKLFIQSQLDKVLVEKAKNCACISELRRVLAAFELFEILCLKLESEDTLRLSLRVVLAIEYLNVCSNLDKILKVEFALDITNIDFHRTAN